ncbi:MAG: SRPBCC domain-containing protein [Steroidobacteraceae bacterium]
METQVIDEQVLISASLEQVWKALTDPEVTVKYWGGTRIESAWKKGAAVLYRRDGEVVDEHELREVIPNRLIEHTFRPMFGEFKTEPSSLLTILLSSEANGTRVQVLHRDFPPSSKVFAACSEGWPAILGALKSLLETP